MNKKILKINNQSFLIFLLCFFTLSAWSQNDTIVLKNNDKIIGEIKEMNQGVVTVKTSYSDKDFKIKWRNVVKVNTEQSFLISLSEGRRYSSNLVSDNTNPESVLINHFGIPYSIKIKDIVYLQPQKSSFFSKMRFSTISAGYSYTKSNSLSQLTINSTLYFSTFKYKITGTYNSVISTQSDASPTQRLDANLQLLYYMKKDWFYMGQLGFLSNDEQKLKLRTLFSGGVGKYLIHSNTMALGTGGGLAYTNESFDDIDNTVQNSLELYFSIGYQIYDYKDLSLSTNGTIYPSLTESNRYRIDYYISLSYDLPFDFFIQLSYSYNFDNKPVEDASKADYSLQTTFGWKFK